MSAAAAMPSVPNGGGGGGGNGPPGFNTGPGGTGEKAYKHVSDLVAQANEGFAHHSSIPALLQTADASVRQAITFTEFRRPDFAFVEYLRAYIILADVIPSHKDYGGFQMDHPEQNVQMGKLRRRVEGMQEQFMKIKEIIRNNNERCGTVPEAAKRKSSVGGHVRTESAPVNGNGRPGTPDGRGQRVRPTPSPKPEKLHGRALSNAPAGGRSDSDSLAARFAGLRSGGGAASPSSRPDSRSSNRSSLQSEPLAMPVASDFSGRDPSDGPQRSSSRPLGPRGMPNGAPPLKMPMNLPQEPPAAYSPARNMQTPGHVTAPRFTARSLASSSSRRTPSGAHSAASAHAPNGPSGSGDYFPITNASTPSQLPERGLPKRSVSMGSESTIAPQKLYDYFRLYNVLLIDFRPRGDFDKGHIWHRNLICVEPMSVRQGMSAEELAESLVVGPEWEQELFGARDSFDLVVYCDEDTHDPYPFRNSRRAEGLKYLHEALSDFNQEKPLQRPPVLLQGGVEAWADMTGRQALVSTDTNKQAGANTNGIRRRPLATAKAGSGNSQLKIPKRRLRNYEQLDPEEEKKWRERARAESVQLPQATTLEDEGLTEEPEGEEEEDQVDTRGIDEFNARFPDLTASQDFERQAFASQLPTRAPPRPPDLPAKVPLYPPPPTASQHPQAPTRPAPAAPRMSYTGVSDRQASTGSQTKKDTANRPYIPPKYMPAHVRLPKTGLVNFGNTCYMNSVLQALSATVPLSVFLMDDAYRAQLQRDNWKSSRGILTELYANLIRSLWKGDVSAIRPTTFRNFVKRTSETFNNEDQQDAKEFLELMVDVLHEDGNRMWARSPLRELTEKEEEKREQMPKSVVARTEWGRYTHRDLSFVQGLFAGQHASRLTCATCGFTSTTYEAFWSISVEIPTNSRFWSGGGGRMPTLDDCLRSYFAEERLTKDDQYRCPRCKTFREAIKRLTLTRAPQFLVVHFKRFESKSPSASSSFFPVPSSSSSSLRKIRQPVDFPLTNLSLDPYFLPPPSPAEEKSILATYGPQALAPDPAMQGPYSYDAYAVIRHLGGTMQSGHYVTAARKGGGSSSSSSSAAARGPGMNGTSNGSGAAAAGNKEWMWFNDTNVTDFVPSEVPGTGGRERDLRGEEAYIVFYQRV
ncbi:cysteine proteinase [Hortaea werneckii]|nr:cysteine proteinase [Hortaea werneckii]KAI7104530.1 cysteine proteinase [Hortaea werneckii]KAI7244611.1 cysteine proteinase [Hortaea werneckii]KAI7305152.1 cysteine proteinase [Hortaea werneckii]KAI7460879.1 cysteine proteinase [Hortaea werneckii]